MSSLFASLVCQFLQLFVKTVPVHLRLIPTPVYSRLLVDHGNVKAVTW